MHALKNSYTLFGLILGLAGAILDFATGYLILADSMMMTTTNSMGVTVSEFDSSAFGWGIGIFALGTLLLITSLASLSQAGMRRMGLFEVLMTAYGLAMLFVGGAMYSGLTPTMMRYAVISSIGMFVVGALMILSGVLMLMRRDRAAMM